MIVPFLSVVENPTQRQDLYNLETKLINEGKMEEKDRYRWPNNKLIIFSSASYKFEYMYKLYSQFEDLIQNPEKNNDVLIEQLCSLATTAPRLSVRPKLD